VLFGVAPILHELYEVRASWTPPRGAPWFDPCVWGAAAARGQAAPPNWVCCVCVRSPLRARRQLIPVSPGPRRTHSDLREGPERGRVNPRDRWVSLPRPWGESRSRPKLLGLLPGWTRRIIGKRQSITVARSDWVIA